MHLQHVHHLPSGLLEAFGAERGTHPIEAVQQAEARRDRELHCQDDDPRGLRRGPSHEGPLIEQLRVADRQITPLAPFQPEERLVEALFPRFFCFSPFCFVFSPPVLFLII